MERHPSWLAARLFRTGSLAVIATETGDSSVLVDAVKQARMCEELAPNSPFMWLACLVTYQVAIQFESDPDNLRALRQNALRLVTKLKDRPRWQLGADVRAKYFRYVEKDISTAVEAYQVMLEAESPTEKNATPTEIVHIFAAVAFQDSRETAREAIKIIEKIPGSWSETAVAMLDALVGNEITPIPSTEQDPYVALNTCWAFLIAKDVPSASQTAVAFLRTVPLDEPASWYSRGAIGGRTMLEFLARPTDHDIDKILREADDMSLLDAHMVRFTLALYHRANEKPEAANQCMQDVISSGPFYSIPRSWAVALNERWDLEDSR